MFNDLVVCPTARVSVYFDLFYKHAGYCTCYWCARDNVFIGNKHLGHCSCEWCTLEIKGTLGLGANEPHQLSKDFSNYISKQLYNSMSAGSTNTTKYPDTSLSMTQTFNTTDSNCSDNTSLDTLKLHNTLINTSQGSRPHSYLSNDYLESNTGYNISIQHNTTQGGDSNTLFDANESSYCLSINSSFHLKASWFSQQLTEQYRANETMCEVIDFSGSLPHDTLDIQNKSRGNCSLIDCEGATSNVSYQTTVALQPHNKSTCGKQNNWGFIPKLSFTSVGTGDIQRIDHTDMGIWVKLAYERTRQHDVPNYLGARIQVISQLDIRQWRHLLADYKFNRVCDYIQFGFPLSLDYSNFNYNVSVKNHASAVQFPKAVDEYLETEKAYNAIVGPFEELPFTQLHVSPMMTRPKPDGSQRIIVDLSWPHGDSVNSYIPDNIFDNVEFTLCYPTVDHIVEQIASMGPKALIYKVDLKRAYRNLRTDPRDFTVLGLQWRDKRYIDISVPFGLKSGASACQMVTQCVTHLMATQGHWTCAYLDDIVGVSLPNTANNAFTSLINLIQTLGLPVNQEKVVAPAEEIICLGICINARSGILTIPEEKIIQVKRLCTQWLSRTYATRKSLQKLLGHLIYLHKCVPPSRLFVNRILQVLRQTPA